MAGKVKEKELATRERLLAVAERLFAQQGFEAVSLRSITREAEVNVASVNYHFHGKQGLIDAVMMQHAGPVNQQRRDNLVALLADEESLTVRRVLHAFFEPFISQITSSEQSEMLLMKFMARMSEGGGCAMPPELASDLRDVIQSYIGLLARCLPEVSSQELFKRLQFTFGAVCHAMLHGEDMRNLSPDADADLSIGPLLEDLVDFSAAGFESLVKPSPSS